MSPAPARYGASETELAVCTVIKESTSSQITAVMQAFRRTVENGPLYRISAIDVGLKSCQIRYDTAVMELEYQFRDDSWLNVKRDMRIEFTEQEVYFVSPPSENPLTILAETELLTFGPEGCGMDWQQSEIQPVQDEPGVTEAIFHGDACNCQARIRRNAAGSVVSLLFRSAC